MIAAITFDATGTLFHAPRLGELYSEVLGRHGIEVAPREAVGLIRLVWQELGCLTDPGRDRFTSYPGGERGWWQRFLERFCELLEAPPPTRFAASELFHLFGRAEAWEVFPEVAEVLAALRGRGLKLAVISNWDHRLPGLLEDLGLARWFDAVVYSSAVGVEKPDRRIYGRALELLAADAGEVLHVGDRRLEDAEGAMAAGFQALLLDRRGGAGADLRDLSPLPELAAGAARPVRAGAGAMLDWTRR